MQVDMAMFADAASALDGKLYIHGGGITRINAPALPLVHPQLALVVRFLTEKEELRREHVITLRLTDPEGTPVLPDAALQVPPQPPPPKETGEPTYLQMAVGIGPVPFMQKGTYKLTVLLDGESVRVLPLAVVPIAPDEAQGEERSGGGGGAVP